MPPDSQSFGRNSFQLIRLVLAIAVLYRHSFDLLAADHADVVMDLIPPRTHLGPVALCFFMVVSGFLVTRSWSHSDGWIDFLRRRVLRVYPAFVVASVFSAFVAAPMGSPNSAADLGSIDLVGFVTGAIQLDKLSIPPSFLSNPYPGPINGSLWSIKSVDLSYGMYRYAWPVQQLLVQGIGGWLNPWTLSLAALTVSAGLAWVIWTVVERPFLALKRRACPQTEVAIGQEAPAPGSAPRS